RWAATYSQRDVPFETEPRTGLVPIEFFDLTDDFRNLGGRTAEGYATAHFGTEIMETRQPGEPSKMLDQLQPSRTQTPDQRTRQSGTRPPGSPPIRPAAGAPSSLPANAPGAGGKQQRRGLGFGELAASVVAALPWLARLGRQPRAGGFQPPQPEQAVRRPT